MKKIIIKLAILSALVSTTSLCASSYVFNTKSLVGIEGSYNSFDVENSSGLRDKAKYGGVGLKIGAQTDNYRLFLSARDNFISGYDYAYSMGAEAQYMMNFSSFANFYLGAAGGYTNLRFEDSANLTREVSSPYIGGDVGFNVHFGDSLDLELGGRVVKLTDSSHLQNGVTYNFDNIITGYMSLIFKYSMDKF